MRLLTAEELTRRFHEKGGGGIFTKPFAEQARVIQSRLARLLCLLPGESAAIAYFIHEYCWVVLTTERLLWQDGRRSESLPLDRIGGVQLDMYDFLRKGRMNMDTLHVVVKGGGNETHRFQVESGGPFWGFYGALRLAVGDGGISFNGPGGGRPGNDPSL